jgi:type II secretory pathway component PulC
MLENISEVLTQARAVQIKNPDGSLCFKMQEVVPGSIFTQLNIQEGDKVCGINGKKIQNVAELMNMFGQIDKIDHFELDVNKNGIDQNLEYDFE